MEKVKITKKETGETLEVELEVLPQEIQQEYDTDTVKQINSHIPKTISEEI